MSQCDDEINTLHASLIHKAREICFQLAYKNGALDAEIICLTQKNVQSLLEEYFSQVGIPKKNIIPTGLKNNNNLNYTLSDEFIPDSLEVWLSGNKLTPIENFVEGVNKKSFTIVLDPEDPDRLNIPPQQNEALTVNILKRITFNTKGGN